MKIEWKKIVLIGSPEPRWGHTCVSLPNNYGLIVFGGNSNRAFNDMQFFNIYNNSWSKIEALGNPPSERYGHSAVVYQPTRSHLSTTTTTDSYQIIFFGGRATSKPFSDVNILYVNNNRSFIWKQITSKSIEGRAGHTSVVYKNNLVVFGGHNNYKSKYYNSIQLFNLDTLEWKNQICSGTAPCARATHCTFIVSNRMYIFGGFDGKKYYNDLHMLDLDQFVWTKLNAKGLPPKPRSGHSSTLIRNDRLLVFGGCGSDSSFLNDAHILCIYSPTDVKWEQPSQIGIELPSPRFRHTANLLNNKILIYAGTGSGNLFGDIHQAEIYDDSMIPLLPSPIPTIQTNGINFSSSSGNSQSSGGLSVSSSPSSFQRGSSSNDLNLPSSPSSSLSVSSSSAGGGGGANMLSTSSSSLFSNSSSSSRQTTTTTTTSNSNNNNIELVNHFNSHNSSSDNETEHNYNHHHHHLRVPSTSSTTTTTLSTPPSPTSPINIVGTTISNNTNTNTNNNSSSSSNNISLVEGLKSLNINNNQEIKLRKMEEHINHRLRHEQKSKQALEDKLNKANQQIYLLTDQIKNFIQKDSSTTLKKDYNDLKKKHSHLYSEDIDDLTPEAYQKLEDIHFKSLEKLRLKKIQKNIMVEEVVSNLINSRQNHVELSTSTTASAINKNDITKDCNIKQQQQQQQTKQTENTNKHICNNTINHCDKNQDCCNSSSSRNENNIESKSSSIASSTTNSNAVYLDEIQLLKQQLAEKDKLLKDKDDLYNQLKKDYDQFQLSNLDSLDSKQLFDLETIYHNGLRQISNYKDQRYLNRLVLLEKEKDQLKDQNTCVICAVNAPNVVILPCRHSSFCTGCISKLEKCPICRSTIANRIEIFN